MKQGRGKPGHFVDSKETAPPMATAEQRADHQRDHAKHEWRPGDRMPLDQRLALAKLIGYAEGITSSGILGELGEFRLRAIIAETLVAFNMTSSREAELIGEARGLVFA